ncbi:MAG TPA: acetyl-CoA carboxylase biotin carboxyl carrier protein [Thermoanaerobaculia bacterium]|nr:acetyl-CoA carboxylase biotin carboxyl carrier protein [Thermoanaerobaculia bacterium]
MLTFEQIKELAELVGRHRLHAIEIERAGLRVRIVGEPQPAPPAAVALVPAAPAAAAIEAPSAAPASLAAAGTSEPQPAPAADLYVVSSPIVGTFYAAPSPDSEPYARIGDRVKKGQVLCIVEAMKLMNEIESDADGVVAEIYPKNAQPVEFGEPLFGLRRD